MNFKKTNDPFANLVEEFFSLPVGYRNEKREYNNNISENRVLANLLETKGDYQYELSTPGFSKEEITINLNENTLSIKGEKNVESTNTDKDYLTKEFYSQKFFRTFNVPENIVLDEIYAKVENGITTLFLPKEKLGKTTKINRDIEII
jgi:HSP20 family protein